MTIINNTSESSIYLCGFRLCVSCHLLVVSPPLPHSRLTGTPPLWPICPAPCGRTCFSQNISGDGQVHALYRCLVTFYILSSCAGPCYGARRQVGHQPISALH